MAKLKLTKNELKKQKDALKRYDQYLPTLLLKKQQLQMEILKLHQLIEQVEEQLAYKDAEIYTWIDVFAENIKVEKLVQVDQVLTSTGNIAGIDIPVFEDVTFKEEQYDFKSTPLWVDEGIKAIKEITTLNARIQILEEQERLIKDELRVTTQRVNLFEKVVIPRTRENIRRIRIYQGDMQTAAVVSGKIAKDKILRNALKEQVSA